MVIVVLHIILYILGLVGGVIAVAVVLTEGNGVVKNALNNVGDLGNYVPDYN